VLATLVTHPHRVYMGFALLLLSAGLSVYSLVTDASPVTPGLLKAAQKEEYRDIKVGQSYNFRDRSRRPEGVLRGYGDMVSVRGRIHHPLTSEKLKANAPLCDALLH
jgi:hypothetical protein